MYNGRQSLVKFIICNCLKFVQTFFKCTAYTIAEAKHICTMVGSHWLNLLIVIVQIIKKLK